MNDTSTVTILTDSMMSGKESFADNPPKEILWNSWQYKILKNIYNGVYNAEIIWCYNEKYGKVGKSVLEKQIVKYYGAQKYHRELRSLGRMLDELKEQDQFVRAIIVKLPYTIEMSCRVHTIDAIKDIEDYIRCIIAQKTKHPVVIFLAPRVASKVLGIDFDSTFELLALREISLPIFADSLPAEELIHHYET